MTQDTLKNLRNVTQPAAGAYEDTIKFSGSERKYHAMVERFGERYIQYRKGWRGEAKNLFLPFPLHIDMALTNKCNLRCVICMVPECDKCGGIQISSEILAKFEQEAQEHNLCSINLGGEPLVEKEFFYDALKMIKRIPVMDFFIHTNATLMNEEDIERILDSNCTTLCISLDATTAETYKTVRRKDYLTHIEKMLVKFKKCREERGLVFPFIHLSFCVNPINLNEKDMFIERWKYVGDIFAIQDYFYNEAWKAKQPKPTEAFKKIGFTCDSPSKRLSIYPNGDVSACCSTNLGDLIIGNINNNTLASLWKGEKIKTIRESLLDSNKDTLCESCKVCLSSVYTTD